MIASGEDSPEALSGFVKFHPQYPVLKVPGGASRPAVRFAFPLGARLNITLRARPCQELFSESFSRPSRGPRGAPPSGPLPFAAASSVLYAPPAPRRGGKPARTQDADNSSAVKREDGMAGMRALRRHRARRFAPARMHGAARSPGVSPRPMSIDATAPEVRRLRASALRGDRLGCVYSTTYIGRRIGLTFRPGVLRLHHASRAFPCSLPPSFSRRGSLPKEERPPPGPPAFRAGNPLDDRPWSILYVGGFPIISILKKLRRDRLFECSSASTASDPTHVCRSAPGTVLKPKRRGPADAALSLNRRTWRQSYASLKNFFLPT